MKNFVFFYYTRDNMLKLYYFMREYHLLPKKAWKCVVQEGEKDTLMHIKHTRTEELEKLKLDTPGIATPYLQHDYFHTTYYQISRYYWW